MTDTPRPRTPFAAHLTPEVAAEWEAVTADNRRARREYRNHPTTTHWQQDAQPCDHCPCHTPHKSGLCSACRKEPTDAA